MTKREFMDVWAGFARSALSVLPELDGEFLDTDAEMQAKMSESMAVAAGELADAMMCEFTQRLCNMEDEHVPKPEEYR